MGGTKAILVLLNLSVIFLVSSFTVIAQLADNDIIVAHSHIAQPPLSSASLPPLQSPNPPHNHRKKHHHRSPPPPTHSSPPPPPKQHTHPSPPPPPVHHSPPPPKTPTPPPPKPPTHPAPPPPKTPTPPPPKPHTPPPPPPPHPGRVVKKPIAVRGLVYCKSCKYRGVDKLDNATSIQGAVVKLACNNTKYHLSQTSTTDKNGFFLFYMPKFVSSAGYKKCKVFLVKSPNRRCNVKTNVNLGKVGAPLIPTPLEKPAPYNLYTVGPFAFEPSKKLRCPR